MDNNSVQNNNSNSVFDHVHLYVCVCACVLIYKWNKWQQLYKGQEGGINNILLRTRYLHHPRSSTALFDSGLGLV